MFIGTDGAQKGGVTYANCSGCHGQVHALILHKSLTWGALLRQSQGQVVHHKTWLPAGALSPASQYESHNGSDLVLK